jgi:hypothetical protein
MNAKLDHKQTFDLNCKAATTINNSNFEPLSKKLATYCEQVQSNNSSSNKKEEDDLQISELSLLDLHSSEDDNSELKNDDLSLFSASCQSGSSFNEFLSPSFKSLNSKNLSNEKNEKTSEYVFIYSS